MAFKLEFRTNSAAFNEDPTEEISQILGQIIERVIDGSSEGTIRDINGTVIGEYDIKDD